MQYAKIRIFYHLLSKYSFKQPNSFSQFMQLRFIFNQLVREKVNICLLGNSKFISNLSFMIAEHPNLLILSSWTPGLISNRNVKSFHSAFPVNLLVIIGVKKNVVALREARQKNIPVICFSQKATIQKYKSLLSHVFFFDAQNLKSMWFILFVIFF